jgi:regulatory protein
VSDEQPPPRHSGEQHRARRAIARRRPGAAAPGELWLVPPPPDDLAQDGEPDPHEVARHIVLRQLTGSPKSRSQLAAALHRRGCDDDVAAAVLDRLEQVGLVDDAAFADSFVRSRQAGRGLAAQALARELRAKGVDDETTRAALDGVDPAAEEERARQLVAKRLGQLHGLDAVVQTRRLAGLLARKGYPAELSMRVIREALANAPEHQRD